MQTLRFLIGLLESTLFDACLIQQKSGLQVSYAVSSTEEAGKLSVQFASVCSLEKLNFQSFSNVQIFKAKACPP